MARPSSLTSIRYREIEQFLQERKNVEEWIALDDDPALFPPNCPRLLLCETGFGEMEERALRRVLGSAGAVA
jgi:hypothetical protein